MTDAHRTKDLELCASLRKAADLATDSPFVPLEIAQACIPAADRIERFVEALERIATSEWANPQAQYIAKEALKWLTR